MHFYCLNLFKLTFILVGLGLFGLVSSTQAQSLYSLFDGRISISPATGQSALPSYLLRFGIFTNSFTPTAANFSQWDANFVGATGTFDGITGAYAARFSASNHSVYPLNAQLYMVVYDVAPSASISSATRGTVITHTQWTVRSSAVVDGRTYNWDYHVTGVTRTAAGRNFDEGNVLPLTDVSNFSSPVNTFSLGGSGGTLGGVLQTSFDMVPEPSSASMVLAGLAGVLAARRRK